MARRLLPDEVTTAARLAGVPPELALAVWSQESGRGANDKTSPKGAVGPFQVMPATFKRYYPNGDINDPVDNMTAGLRVLADGLKQSGGDPEGAAQFYYHGAVLRPGEEGPNSGKGTPSTREYGRQVVARMGGSAPVAAQPPSAMPSLYGGQEEPDSELGPYAQGDEPETDPEEEPDIAGLTRPLNTAMGADSIEGDWMPPMGEDYDLDRYIKQIVDEELGHA